jgi:hypothetical protein
MKRKERNKLVPNIGENNLSSSPEKIRYVVAILVNKRTE